MATGTQYKLKLHEDATGTIVFDKFELVTFTHDTTFVTPVTTVKFEDYPGAHLDAFDVQTSYPSGQEPSHTSTTISGLIAGALAAIDAAIAAGNTGGGSPSVDPISAP
jgi:hypothetical protein